MAHGLETVRYVVQIHDYLVYGHGDTLYAETMSWRYHVDRMFLSRRFSERYSYRLLRQWYYFSVFRGRFVLRSDLSEMRCQSEI